MLGRRIRTLAAGVLAVGVLVGGVPSVAAGSTTLGTLTAPMGVFYDTGPWIYIQQSVAPGTNPYSVPFDGVLTDWTVDKGPANTNPTNLEVLRPTGGGQFTVLAETTATFGGTTPLAPPIQVHAGDVIGVGNAASAMLGPAGDGSASASDVMVKTGSDPPPGTTGVTFGSPVANERADVAATLVGRPVVTSLSPNFGSPSGGTTVTINGAHFADVPASGAVKFGATAASYTVLSDTAIRATAPSAPLGPVNVTVTDIGGTSSGSIYTYSNSPKKVRCVVPKLKGKTLKKARKLLKKAHCRLGKVKGRKGKHARIRKQQPKPGTVLNAGSKVRVTTRRRHH